MQRFNQRHTAHRGPLIPPRLSHEKGGTLSPAQRKGAQGNSGTDPGTPSSPQPDDTDVRGGVYVISVAARILSVHPQTLRKYERLGLVTPTRSIGMLRLYSAEDVVRVRLIKYMVDSLGMNLAGVVFALALVNRIMDLRKRIQAMSQAEALNQIVVQELEEMLRELGSIFPDNLPRV
ncbi:MAG: MerR family transcriptional regulator [Chloroflexi bacterium]|nr:MerR family transcriptional regulator [Chloroflexota bacterium]